MAYSKDLPKVVATRIFDGELPSAVLRSVLENNGLNKSDLGPLLIEAMDNENIIHYVWWWYAKKESDAQDTQFNVRVIKRLLEFGVSLPWTLDYCASEEMRIQPLLAVEIAEEKEAAIAAVSFENLMARIEKLEGTPACIQAIWDGDTQGWYVWLSVVVRINGKFKEEDLGPIRYGGDIRLFRGEVPPWPEAAYAQDVGKRLAEHFGTVFYFPSPEEPDTDQVGWIEFVQQSRYDEGEKPWWRIW